MNSCTDLFTLSAIACKLSECLSEDELAVLSANLMALGDMLEVVLARRAACRTDCPASTPTKP
ncbi:MAG: hypothetical protein ACI38A_10530 [Candidatus Ornithomonoglobus sp.]